MSSIVIQGDTSGSITVEAPSVAGTHTLTLPKATGTVATNATVGLGTKNLIINGDMRIDQRNSGASASIGGTSTYYIDRWNGRIQTGSGHTIQQVTDAPSDFTSSLKVTIGTGGTPASTDRAFVFQSIEGLNMTHLNWGSSSARQITLSFYVKSSLTGTFGGAIQDSSIAYSYPFTYAISSANTWERKSITVEGPTSGTFSTGNSTGMTIRLDLGTGSNYQGAAGSWSANDYRAASGCTQLVGTSSATWQITGIQLEASTEATPFENRMYSTELTMCQRYYYKIKGLGGGCLFATGWNGSTTVGHYSITLPVTMRTYPTALETSGTATHYQIVHTNTATGCNSTPTYGGETTPEVARVNAPVAGGLTAGQGSGLRAGNIAAYLAWSAEL